MTRGDYVTIHREGREMPGFVGLASGNDRSLMVLFDGFFFGYLGAIPLMRDGDSGPYQDLVQGLEFDVIPEERK